MIVRKRTVKVGNSMVSHRISIASGAWHNPAPSTPRGNRRAAAKRELKLTRRPTPNGIRGAAWHA
jgi:hypothetical protein